MVSAIFFCLTFLVDDFGSLFASLTHTRQRRFNDIRTTFLNYPFSVTLVEGGEFRHRL